MSIHAEDAAKVMSWLSAKNVTKCPACGANQLRPTRVVSVVWADLVESNDTRSYRLRQPSVSEHTGLVQVTCESCHLALHFSAVPFGLKVKE